MSKRPVITALTCALGALITLASSAETAEAGAPKAKPIKIAATDECIAAKDRSVVHVILNVAYTKPEPMKMRYLYQLVCEAGADECTGIQLYLASVEKGQPIAFGELNRIDKAKITSSSKTATTIKWGPLRTFTIDWARGQVQYEESGDESSGFADGRASTKCRVDDFRSCKSDADCFGGLRCSKEHCARAPGAR